MAIQAQQQLYDALKKAGVACRLDGDDIELLSAKPTYYDVRFEFDHNEMAICFVSRIGDKK